MSHSEALVTLHEQEVRDAGSAKTFGFWVYLMTDLAIFASLFACYLVLHGNAHNGPTARDLFDLPSVLVETIILLTSTFTCSLAMLAVYRKAKWWAISGFLVTLLLGVAFLFLEFTEFRDFIKRGAGWERSAFLSSFFTLVATHGFHVSMGLIWMGVMMFRLAIRPITHHGIEKIFCMTLFWHFLDLVWIFIFTIVYGMGYLL
jgi:cytochrome o ubiquinol oxidase subunit III